MAQDQAPTANPDSGQAPPDTDDPDSKKSSLKLLDLPKCFVIDETRFYTDEEEAELDKKVTALWEEYGVRIAIVASPGAIGETLQSDAKNKLLRWFTLRKIKGCVILIHRGSRQVGFASNLHENSPLERPEVQGFVNKIMMASIKENRGDYQKTARVAIDNILTELPALLKRLAPTEE